MQTKLEQHFHFRPATLDDIPQAVDLFNTYSMATVGHNQDTVDSLNIFWRTPGFDLNTHTLMAITSDGRLAGYGEVWNTQSPHVHVYGYGCVLPEYWGMGLGRYLDSWINRRAMLDLPKAPEGARVMLMCSTADQDVHTNHFLQRAGYQLERRYYQMRIEMQSPPPSPVLPEGILIRSMIPNREERAVVQAIDDSFQDHWGFVQEPFEQHYERLMAYVNARKDYDPSLWFVAMAGDRIAGFSLCYPSTDEDSELAWLQTLGVLRPWRKQGLGLALLHHTFGEFYRRGINKVGLGVDATSLTGATRLYERAGMHIHRQYNTYARVLRDGVELGTQTLEN